jgi:hypothetical protein
MVPLNKVRRLFAVMQELGLYTEPLLNIGFNNELIAEFWFGDKYLSIEINGECLDVSGMDHGVHTDACIQKGWLYETP